MSVDRGRRTPDRFTGAAPRRGGRAARLADAYRDLDRRARFQERLAAVQATHDRAIRRRARIRAAAWATLTIGALAVGSGLAGWRGAAAAAAGLLAIALGARLLAWLAARRGATAWDWQAGRYRLYGDPAGRVQALDRPPDQRGGLNATLGGPPDQRGSRGGARSGRGGARGGPPPGP